MFKKDVFSIRKTKLGVGSLLLGSLFFLGSVDANAETVTKEFNDIETTVEVIGENVVADDLSLTTTGGSQDIYILNEDFTSDGYVDYLKVTATPEELNRGFDYIKSTYSSRPEKSKRLTKSEIDSQGGFKDGDIIITGTSTELQYSSYYESNLNNLKDLRLPYVYFPEKEITWSSDGNLGDIPISNFTDFNPQDVPENITVDVENIELPSLTAVGYERLDPAWKYNISYNVGGRKYSESMNMRFFQNRIIMSETYHDTGRNTLYVTRNFNVSGSADSPTLTYDNYSTSVFRNGQVFRYNVGMPSYTSDGKVGTRLAKIYFEGQPYDWSTHSTVSFRGWGDFLSASSPKYGSPTLYSVGIGANYDNTEDRSVPDSHNHTEIIIAGVNNHWDNSTTALKGFTTAIWRDGKEPTPLKVGESVVKEYKLVDTTSGKELTDWIKVTFVGDTRQYDDTDDIKELSAEDYFKFKNSEGSVEFRYFGGSRGGGNFSEVRSSPDGSHMVYYEERKKQNFETGGVNLGNYDGYSWDLVPSYPQLINSVGEQNPGANAGELLASGVTFMTLTGDKRASTLNVYRVRKEENGSVIVAYENESGEVIKNEETLIDNQPVGTQYTSEPTDTIVGTNGQTYYKVKLKDGSQPATGDVTKETKKVTWVYRLPEVTDVKGKVVVKYVDTEGRELLTEYATDENVVSTIVNRFTADGGKQLVSSTPTNETYNVEAQKHPKITDQNIVYNFKEVKDSKSLTGTLVEGETVITLVYGKTPTETREELGHVKVVYTDENGREIDTAVVKPDEVVNRIVEQPMVDGTKTTVSTTPTNATYDVTSDKKASIEFDGFEYTFKEVKDVQPTGTLSVGETVVTYVYEVVPKVETVEEKGTVKVKFVDSTGRVIRDEMVLFTDELVNTKTTTRRPDGEPVVVDVPTNTEYNAGVSTVKLGEVEFEEFRYVFKSQDGETPLTGKIPVGETVITFVYDIEPKTSVTEEKGTVKVKYVDETGRELKETLVHKNDVVVNRITTKEYPENYTGEKAEPVSEPTNEEYDTTGDDIKLPSIDFENYTYNFLKQKENDPEPKGKVVKGETVITYIYRAVPKTNDEQQKGTVKVRYVDTDGNVLRDDTVLVNDQLVNTRTRVSKPGVEDEFSDAPTNIEYDASLPTVKLPTLDSDGYTYNFSKQKGTEPLTGKVTTGETLITYVYEVVPKESRVEKKGSVVVRFVTEDGVELKKDVQLLTDELVSTTITKTRPDKDDEVITNETGKRYDATTVADEYLEKDGTRYKKVRVDGVESGKLPEGNTTITYVYKNWMPKVEETKQYGNVVVRYLEKGTEKELLSPKDALDNTLVNTHKKVTSPEGEVTESDVPTNATYDVTDFKYPFVTSEGVKYNWVSEDKPVVGVLSEGELVITFYYEVNSNGIANTTENGTVIVKYQDDLGNDLKSPVTLKDNVVVNDVKTETFKDGTADKVTKEPTGETYDTNEVKESEIEFEGFIYRLTPKVTGKETGDVPVGITEVIYVYEAVPKVEESFEKGSVIVHFRDKDGNELVESKKIVDEVNVSKITVTTTPKHGERVVDDLNVEYDSTTVREDEIVVKGIKYKRIVDRIDGIEKGKVGKGDTVVIYYYEEVKEEPKVDGGVEPKPEPPKEELKKPEPKPQPKPEPRPEPKPEPKPQPKPEPKPEPTPEPEPKPEPVVPPKEDGELVVPKPQPEPVVEQPVVENKQETNIHVSEALELPSTGEQDLSIFAPAVLSILSAVGLIGYSRKED